MHTTTLQNACARDASGCNGSNEALARRVHDRAAMTERGNSPAARVLLAEDDANLRAMMADRLRDDGCEVLEAIDGYDTITKLDGIADTAVPFANLDLVVMDVRMPGMSGLEITYLLRSWRWRTPVMLVTAYPDADLLKEAARLGAALLAKPFGLRRFGQAAREVLQGGVR